MNKQELSAMVAQILQTMGSTPAPADDGAVADVTALDLRKLYMVENALQPEEFRRLKARTPARLGCGRCGARYPTLTMLRFRADHAAAQDAVFSQADEDFAARQGLLPLQTLCESKEEYLTRPDRGRIFSEETQKQLKAAFPTPPRVLIVVGDGLSAAAVQANAPDCMAAIRDGLKVRGIETGQALFVRYCRVGAGDAIGDAIGCEVVCMLVGERPGLVTDKSMSAYITYKPHIGVLESARTVVSNIHAQGTPAVEAGAHIAQLIATILEKKISGVGLHGEVRP